MLLTHEEDILGFFLYFAYTVKKICLKITVPVLEVFRYKQCLKIQTYLCRKFQVSRVPENNSDNRKITAAVYLKFIDIQYRVFNRKV